MHVNIYDPKGREERMREIKFRAWDKVYKCFLQSFLIDEFGNIYNSIGLGGRDITGEVIISQHTGLKDKNGKDIYEGDIIEWLTGEIGVISWHVKGFWSVKWQKKNTSINDRLTVFCGEIHGGDGAEYKKGEFSDVNILGNIYENPELLPESK
jgi:uncharacterized phage protein (TIGR01671 family)